MKSIARFFVQFYLKLYTKIILWRFKPFIIAVAGTTNKTTVKEYILKFLREKYGQKEVRGNPRSYNTEIGLPLSILYLESGESSFWKWWGILIQAKLKALFSRQFPSKLVLELGVEKEGDMKYLLEMVHPSWAVVTNIEGSYSDAESNLDDIFEEMKKLVKKLPSDGKLILNFDDARVKSLVEFSKVETISYGFSEEADACVANLKTTVQGQTFDFSFQGKFESVEIKKYGRHNVYAWMIAKIVKEVL
ncbi:MAG TPA: Mur ligase family protein [Candidatus Bathyarchaeia archaeon]|nr:Mur ligase family protein [Candidatus Bathyarchaeia archaeon]